MAVIATLRKGYDLDYIWKQIDAAQAARAVNYYIQPAEAGGEPPGRWWGPAAEALGFQPGQVVERKPYELLFGGRRAPDDPPGQKTRQRQEDRRPLPAAPGRRAARDDRAQARAAPGSHPPGPAEPAVLRPDPVAVEVDLDLPRFPRRERPPGP